MVYREEEVVEMEEEEEADITLNSNNPTLKGGEQQTTTGIWILMHGACRCDKYKMLIFMFCVFNLFLIDFRC